MRLQINERGEVVIKNKGVHEAEILESDLNDLKLSKECEKILEEKTNKVSRALKAALERIMEGEKAEYERFFTCVQIRD